MTKEGIIISINISSKNCKRFSPSIFAAKKKDSVWLKLFCRKKSLSWFQALECRKFSCRLTWVSDIETKHPWSIIQTSHLCLPCLPHFLMPLQAQVNALSYTYGFKPEWCSKWDWKLKSGAAEMSVPWPARWWYSKVFPQFYNKWWTRSFRSWVSRSN